MRNNMKKIEVDKEDVSIQDLIPLIDKLEKMSPDGTEKGWVSRNMWFWPTIIQMWREYERPFH